MDLTFRMGRIPKIGSIKYVKDKNERKVKPEEEGWKKFNLREAGTEVLNPGQHQVSDVLIYYSSNIWSYKERKHCQPKKCQILTPEDPEEMIKEGKELRKAVEVSRKLVEEWDINTPDSWPIHFFNSRPTWTEYINWPRRTLGFTPKEVPMSW